ncbi:GntR family transcriptional regulator [Hydrogenophaga sp. T2]|uniref:GntR family transcriptional regulator n=1 Tax=Hydrogenophaga sp. T2 TaxID=3132823 RepID=UPI003CF909B7
MPAPRTRRPATPPSRADGVYEQLKRDIADFHLLPGDRFTENELCERLGVSRTPVRQALIRLQQEGFVEVMFRAGWRVLPFDFNRFDQLYELRLLLETAAVQRLCQQDGPPGALLQGLKEQWMVAAADRETDPARVAAMDEAFHQALVRAAGNDELSRVHQDVTERIRIIRRLDFLKPVRIDATYDEHAKILRAVLAHNADRAALLLRTHIQTSQVEVRKITLHQVFLARQTPGG